MKIIFLILVAVGTTVVKAEQVGATITKGGPNRFLGVVFGATQCESPGEFLRFSYQDCSSPNEICRVHADNVRRAAQVSFKPSADIAQLGLSITVGGFNMEDLTLFDKIIQSSAVEAGVEYQLNVSIGPPQSLRGKTITVVYQLYNAATRAVEICLTSQFVVM